MSTRRGALLPPRMRRFPERHRTWSRWTSCPPYPCLRDLVDGNGCGEKFGGRGGVQSVVDDGPITEGGGGVRKVRSENLTHSCLLTQTCAFGCLIAARCIGCRPGQEGRRAPPRPPCADSMTPTAEPRILGPSPPPVSRHEELARARRHLPTVCRQQEPGAHGAGTTWTSGGLLHSSTDGACLVRGGPCPPGHRQDWCSSAKVAFVPSPGGKGGGPRPAGGWRHETKRWRGFCLG